VLLTPRDGKQLGQVLAEKQRRIGADAVSNADKASPPCESVLCLLPGLRKAKRVFYVVECWFDRPTFGVRGNYFGRAEAKISGKQEVPRAGILSIGGGAAPDKITEYSVEEACFCLEKIELEGMCPSPSGQLNRLPGEEFADERKRKFLTVFPGTPTLA
jgi:hypothetical protein